MKYIDALKSEMREILKNDETVYFLGEDIAEPYGGAFKVTKGLSDEFQGRIIQTPMSEQGFTGMGIGMAINGLKPIVEIMFGDFMTLTVDQVVNHLTKFHQIYNKRLNMVIRTPSGGYRGYGATHSQSLERLFFGMPGLDIVSPSIFNNPGNLLRQSVYNEKPVIFIENKLDYSRELIEGNKFNGFTFIESISNKKWEMKKVVIEDENPDVTVITYGGMAKLAVEVQQKLFYKRELAIDVITVSNISDINYEILSKNIGSKKVILLEEGWEKFGWGSGVGMELSKVGKYEIDTLGAKDFFIPASKNLEDYVLPSNNQLYEKVINMAGGSIE